MKRTVAELEHLSKSSIEAYQNCSALWEWRYLRGMRQPANPALLIGSAFDAVLERYLSLRTTSSNHTDIPPLSTLWASAWAELTSGETAQQIDWQGELPEVVENVGSKLVHYPGTQELLDNMRVLVDEHGPWLQRQVTMHVPGVPKPIIGYLDFVEADGVPGDFKTAARAWDNEKPLKELQPKIYIAALLQTGYPVPKGPRGGYLFRHFVFLKQRQPRIQRFETEYSAGHIVDAITASLNTWRGISAGIFLKNTQSWLCGPGKCPAWAVCMGVDR